MIVFARLKQYRISFSFIPRSCARQIARSPNRHIKHYSEIVRASNQYLEFFVSKYVMPCLDVPCYTLSSARRANTCHVTSCVMRMLEIGGFREKLNPPSNPKNWNPHRIPHRKPENTLLNHLPISEYGLIGMLSRVAKNIYLENAIRVLVKKRIGEKMDRGYMTIELGNDYELRIYQDENPMNPREEFDNLSTMAFFHRQYNLGDKDLCIKGIDGEYFTIDSKNYNDWDEMESDIEKHFKPVVIYPVYMYDHSGITISLNDFNDRWDSGMIGFVFVSRQKAIEEFGKRITKKILETIRNNVRGEIEIYDSYLRGDVYGYKLIKKNPMTLKTLGDIDNEETEIDSSWGYFGDDINTNGIMENVKSQIV